MLLFLILLSKAENCLCGSVPHRARCHVAEAMKDLFPLPFPSGNANGLGTCGAAETLGSRNQGAALARGMRDIILPAGPGRFAVRGKWKPGVVAARFPRMPIACPLKGFSKTFCTDTQAKLLPVPFLFVVIFILLKQLSAACMGFASSSLLWP